MPARQAQMSSVTASGLSETISFERFVIVTTVSGVASIVWIRSGLTWIACSGWVRRCREIIGFSSLVGGGGGRACRSPAFSGGLAAAQVHEILEHLVGGRDDAPVGLEAT